MLVYRMSDELIIADGAGSLFQLAFIHHLEESSGIFLNFQMFHYSKLSLQTYLSLLFIYLFSKYAYHFDVAMGSLIAQ